MQNIYSKFEFPVELIDTEEKREKFIQRYDSLYTQMQDYIDKSGFSEDVVINELILGYALVDYFEDIERLKDFHKVEHINSIKLTAYTVYWLLRRKPIQLKKSKKELLYVNERFALAFVLGFLSSREKKHIIVRDERGLESFSESLFYFFKFRNFNAQNIELALTAFFAGQIYQETDKDISRTLPASDYESEPWS